MQAQTLYFLMKQLINGSKKIFGQKDLQELELVQLQSMTKILLILGDNIQGKILEKMLQVYCQRKKKRKYLEKEFQCTHCSYKTLLRRRLNEHLKVTK